ncbi:hypothetical protein CGN00_22320 [Salmonella enterica]|nr:hypothetical protein [Salmonella enterica]ECC3804592.1 hypothetical protein [Salmonella enterica subsp. enterica]EDQ6231957.1 hypothetical protein [Salmonella enterica subsp. enterica serovar Tucson]EAM3112138.1 hypothetical protein [Salmonella enterica]EAM3234493.1 hypothetical protein [Salmonella enterica]
MDPLISDSPAKLKQISGGFCIQGLSFRFTPIPGRYYRERPTRMNTVNVGKLRGLKSNGTKTYGKRKIIV